MIKQIFSVTVKAMMILAVTATFTFAQANKDAKAPEAAPGADKKAPAAGEFESDGKTGGEQTPAQTPAEGEAPRDETTDTGKPQEGPFGGNYFFFIMIGGILLLWIFMGRGRKKKEAQRKAMLEQLSKGDRVVTIGGIVGTIVEARETELVVKVDDNTRMKFARWAVRNAGDAANEDKKKDSQEQQ